jgi:hypothetical protein
VGEPARGRVGRGHQGEFVEGERPDRPAWNRESESPDASGAELVEQATEGTSAFIPAESKGTG